MRFENFSPFDGPSERGCFGGVTSHGDINGRDADHQCGFVPAGTCFVAAAVVGAGALGAGATLWGSSQAAKAQTSASQAAIGAQREMFGLTKEQLQPFIDAGKLGIGPLARFINRDDPSSPLNALIKLTTPGANMSETLAQTPGFQFTEDRGLRAVNNALAARGLGGSGGAVAKGAADYTTGLASGAWKDVVDRLLATFTGGSTAMQNLVNTGAGSAGALGGASTQVGGQIGQNLVGIGNAQAGAQMAGANAIGGFGGSLSTAALLRQLTQKQGGQYDSQGMYYGGDFWPSYG
jgi:hypothetical protein